MDSLQVVEFVETFDYAFKAFVYPLSAMTSLFFLVGLFNRLVR